MAYDTGVEGATQPSSAPLRYNGHSFDGLTINNKHVDNPSPGNNYECVHVEDVNDVRITNILGTNWGKQLVRLFGCQNVLIENCRGDSELNKTADFAQGIVFGKSNDPPVRWGGTNSENVSLSNVKIENVRYGGSQSYVNGDGVTVEKTAHSIYMQDIEIGNCVDTCMDLKGGRTTEVQGWYDTGIGQEQVIVRNATLWGGTNVDTGAPLSKQRYGIRCHAGLRLMLINCHFASDLGNFQTCFQMEGANAEFPVALPDTYVRHFNVTYDTGCSIGQATHEFTVNQAPGSVLGDTGQMWVEMASDPFADGTYSTTGLILHNPNPQSPPNTHRTSTQMDASGHRGKGGLWI